jgi:Ca2+:H+ antiporter
MGSAEIMKLSVIDLEKVHISFVKVEFLLLYEQDISLGVAIGSSTQISMFVIPLCVIIGWPMGTRMDLNFQLFETGTLFITVLVVAFMLQVG